MFAIAPDWRGRVFAFLRFVAFVVLFLAADFGVNVALHSVLTFQGHLEVKITIAAVCAALVTLFIAFVMAKVARRDLADYGYRSAHKARNFLVGVAGGIALLGLLLFIIHAMGGFTFGPLNLDIENNIFFGTLIAVMSIATAVNEEALFRGYSLVELSRTMSFWPAAIVLALLFGLVHVPNEGAQGMVGGAQAALFALIAAYSFRVTGSLWLAMGLHAGWNYAESFVFGVPDSGLALPGGLTHGAIHGPDWLTGGTAGPEGSVLATLPLLLMLVFVWACRRRNT